MTHPFRVTLNGPEADGSWSVDVEPGDGRHLLTAGVTAADAIANAIESWPELEGRIPPVSVNILTTEAK